MIVLRRFGSPVILGFVIGADASDLYCAVCEGVYSKFERCAPIDARDFEGSEVGVFHDEFLLGVFGSVASRDAGRRFGLVAVQPIIRRAQAARRHAALPGRRLVRCMRAVSNSSPMKPRRRSQHRNVYFGLSVSGRVELADLLCRAWALMARQSWM